MWWSNNGCGSFWSIHSNAHGGLSHSYNSKNSAKFCCKFFKSFISSRSYLLSSIENPVPEWGAKCVYRVLQKSVSTLDLSPNGGFSGLDQLTDKINLVNQ